MKEIAVAARKRTEGGKGPARRVRQDGFIPGIIYGPETEPVSVAVNEKEFRSSMKGVEGTSLIDLNVDGDHRKVVLREIQRDPVTSRVIHVDFHAISMNKPINVAVPIHYIGTPIGVKTDGGIMQVTMRELEVSCLPTSIPDHLDIDVEELRIGESIHVSDVTIPEAKILSETRRTIVVIAAPTVHKEEVAEEVEGEEVEGEAVEGEGEAAADGAEAKAPSEDDDKKKDEDQKKGGDKKKGGDRK